FLLSRYNDQTDIIFGVTMSGRSIELDNIEEMIGIFINTLPMRVLIEKGSTVKELLLQLQKNMINMTRRSSISLQEINALANKHIKINLFNSIIVFENYPKTPNHGPSTNDFTIGNITAIEKVEYPLTILVQLGEALSFSFNYETEYFDEPGIKQIIK